MPEQTRATPDDLFQFLSGEGIAVTTVEHPPLFTVEESRRLRGEIAGGHSKNLFLKDKKGNIFLVVALEDATIDLKQIHGLIGASGRVSFGKAELLVEVLGVEPGAVTPFGLFNDRTTHRVQPVFDARMMQEEVLNFHPLINTATTTIARDDLLKFARACGHDPRVLAVSEESVAAGL
ncbi:prolyl-tRNA synthetase associated domain-containing protein [Rhodobium gokarnense]|uniref:Ala-tRNA(Pro) deacylase n=1 Tax=Rhodobium gokarnense TaxID=364296 RepID=A0ABT3HHF6_9HYPH|nr:prolyl-tRNA synthetase associated domain-containing protein [Rhodobium gokarnense]MCW2309832.1 Ala-tRNA(Pro) deacylase [Rhodobium gokarnense]